MSTCEYSRTLLLAEIYSKFDLEKTKLVSHITFTEKALEVYSPVWPFKFVVFPFNFRKDYIIDMCSVDRNHILVKTYLVGGASERIIPGMTLSEVIKSTPLLCFGG